nr:MAG TPA: hypothetical protein [Bacteriophage sp.]
MIFQFDFPSGRNSFIKGRKNLAPILFYLI